MMNVKRVVLILAAMGIFLALPVFAGEGTGVGNGGSGKADAEVERLKKEMGVLNLGKGVARKTSKKVKPTTTKKPPQQEQDEQDSSQENSNDQVGVNDPQSPYVPYNPYEYDPAYRRPQYPYPDYRRMPADPRPPLEQVLSWCSRAGSILGRELKRAKMQVQYDRLNSARTILVNALNAVSQSLWLDPMYGNPMTKRLVDRALVLNEALNNAFAGSVGENGRFIEVTKTNFLIKFTEEIITLERALDRPVFIPYYYRYNRCYQDACDPGFSYPDFERQYVDYAKDQLQFVVNEFTLVANDSYGERVVPVGSARAFLVISELMSRFIAEDLANNLFAYENACAVGELMDLSTDLNRYNFFGDRTIFPSEPFAVAGTRESLEHVISNINSMGCGTR